MHERRITLTVYIRVQKFVLSRQIGRIMLSLFTTLVLNQPLKKMSQINYIGKKVIFNMSHYLVSKFV
jgi:hypothetical protein